MATFTLEHETQLSQEETFKKVKEFFKENESLKKLDPALDYTFDDSKLNGQVKGSKFECRLAVSGSSPTKVTVQVNLSFLLTPFKGKIQQTLQEKIQHVLG